MVAQREEFASTEQSALRGCDSMVAASLLIDGSFGLSADGQSVSRRTTKPAIPALWLGPPLALLRGYALALDARPKRASFAVQSALLSLTGMPRPSGLRKRLSSQRPLLPPDVFDDLYVKRAQFLVAVASGLPARCNAHLPSLAEAVVHDHWEVFMGRQDYALGDGTAVGAVSRYVYDIDPAPHRGSGRRPDRKPEDGTTARASRPYVASIKRLISGLIPCRSESDQSNWTTRVPPGVNKLAATVPRFLSGGGSGKICHVDDGPVEGGTAH